MKENKKLSPSAILIWKIVIIAVMTLLMLIPINMIRSQISDRQYAVGEAVADIEGIWGKSQIISGPCLEFNYSTISTDSEGKKTAQEHIQAVYPKDLSLDVSASTQLLHRSIYDVTVYTSEIKINGYYIIPDNLCAVPTATFKISLKDLRGIVGKSEVTFCDSVYEFYAGPDQNILATIPMDSKAIVRGDTMSFSMTLSLKGSEELMFRPVGGLTTVTMQSDAKTPSFAGDFLPTERTLSEVGFKAKWVISQINRGEPNSTLFGVRFLQPVTQYKQTERSLKYAIFIIILIFLTGLFVEFLTKKNIHLVQYLVIGIALVLFYSLLLAISEFMVYGWAYLIASVMTVSALTLYFRAILRNSSAYLLGVLVACAFAVSYMLLQMETYAFLCGTLILFVLICVMMFFTRNMNKAQEQPVPEQPTVFDDADNSK